MTPASTIPWFDLSRQTETLHAELTAALDEVLRGGDFILGRHVEEFEARFAKFVGARHCIGVNSGTSALHAALVAANVQPGDEVVTTPATWISTAWAISYVGARPVFADIDPVSGCLDPQAFEDAITPRTRAVIPVHLFGRPCDMLAICEIADRYDLRVIEDACQAHGSYIAGRHAGTFGQLGCFSFYPGKNLGAFGEAGAVITDDDRLAERIRRLRNHAQPARNQHSEIGFNMRMEGMQGAVLKVKLNHLPRWLQQRRSVAQGYSTAWKGLDRLTIPVVTRRTAPGWHIYALRTHERTSLQSTLAAKGIQTAIHYPTPIHLQPAYKHLNHKPGDFPHAEALCREQLTMPLFPEMTREETERVISEVSAWSQTSPQRLAA